MEICEAPGREIVERRYFVPCIEQHVAEVRADKARATRNTKPHNEYTRAEDAAALSAEIACRVSTITVALSRTAW